METWMILVIAAAVAVFLAIAALAMGSKRRRGEKQTARLSEGFGPEYATAVKDKGRSGAESELLEREQRARVFPVRALSVIEATRYTEDWEAAQAQFVDDPGAALTAAEHVLAEVIAARGYPTTEFEKGASALSVDHPRAVQEYRAAHEVVLANRRNPVDTDELREAMRKYHTVFEEVLA